ncbi:MAG: DNA repair protein RecN [Microthrixaceae bacterium]
MLVELAVHNLGVIAAARVPLRPGLVALTGETGAGKTMLVEALHLLRGGKPDPSRVRAGSEAAEVEGLFVVGDTEWVLRRVVPATGRSRAYVNGALATAGELSELTDELLELHGQHAQQGLLRPSRQRDALDRFAGVDRGELRRARDGVRGLEAELDALGGDERARAREVDLLRYQLDEIGRVAPRPGEEEELDREEDLLAGALAHREAAVTAVDLVAEEGAAADLLARAAAAVQGRAPFEAAAAALGRLSVEAADVARELRSTAEGIEPDEERLTAVRERRHALVELRRKYGEDLAEVLAHAEATAARLAELEGLAERRAEVTAALADARAELLEVSARLGAERRAAAPELARRLERELAALALAGAVVEVAVEDTDQLPGAGEGVEVRLAANQGAPSGPLSRVASGGELSRVMLALRLVLSGGPPTMVFDEVDAGVGGAAATAVGEALAGLASERQVLVVTHLPQVAAVADHQLLVSKAADGAATVTTVEALGEDDRVVELSRMLSGSPESDTARRHARELLAVADRRRATR